MLEIKNVSVMYNLKNNDECIVNSFDDTNVVLVGDNGIPFITEIKDIDVTSWIFYNKEMKVIELFNVIYVISLITDSGNEVCLSFQIKAEALKWIDSQPKLEDVNYVIDEISLF